MKLVRELSKRQIELLLEVWNMAHHAIDKTRQPFTYKVNDRDKLEWDDLIKNGYIEPIPNICNRFILTSNTEGIFSELVAVVTH